MEDPNQIEVPPSFSALFASPSGLRLLQPMSLVRQRYELCEDLAQMLTEQASVVMFRSGRSQREVLRQMQAALTGPESVVEAAEAAWVVRRLAELLNWDAPPADRDAATIPAGGRAAAAGSCGTNSSGRSCRRGR